MQIYKRIALLGATANPNVGDEAVLSSNLQKIRKMYGGNCKIYIFTKDASYTAIYSSDENQIVPVEYLHQFSKMCEYDIERMKIEGETLLNYEDSEKISKEYESLHNIFKEIDVLHIVGGGYLNSLWPDMLYEVVLATRLAKKYEKKYCLTGISVYPAPTTYLQFLEEILSGAEFADFRDDSYKELNLESSINCLQTLDDAICLDDYYANSDYFNYATVLFHDWNGYEEVVLKLLETQIIPFMQSCLSKKIVSHFYILGFSEGDLELWNKISIPSSLIEDISFQNCIFQNTVLTKHLVANAKFNVGSRFHQAVFSLSSQVPVLSIYYDSYYKNKLESIHGLYRSNHVYSIENIAEENFNQFLEEMSTASAGLKRLNDEVENLQLQKDKEICRVYGVNQTDSEVLYNALHDNGSRPKISVIVPIYNMDAYLRECLDSVLSQSLKDIEIICINDGSTDYTQMILSEYAWKDSRIKIITQSNHGVAFSRNRGIASAKGEFLFFLDPDDWLPDDDTFSDMYNAAKKNNVLVCGGTFKEYATRGIIDKWDGNLSKYSFEEEGLISYADYQFDYGWVRFIYNRDFIVNKNLQIPSLTFFEDPVFFVNVMHEAKSFYALKRCTYCYRTGYKSTSLPYSKIVDLMKGLYMNIEFAIKHNYQQLLNLEIDRIENDYGELIIKYMLNSTSTELRDQFNKLNKLLYKDDDNNRIEYRIYNKIIKNKEATVYRIGQEIEESRNVFYSSTTWKIGNLILCVPKMFKNLLLRRKS